MQQVDCMSSESAAQLLSADQGLRHVARLWIGSDILS